LQFHPSAARNQNACLEVFAVSGNRSLLHTWENAPGGDWHEWESLGGHDLAGAPVSIANADGRLQVFILGRDAKIYTREQSMPNWNWGPWIGLGGTGIKGFGVQRNLDGRLEIAAVFSDGTLNLTAQSALEGPWSAWTSLGGTALEGAVAFAANQDGRLEAFAIGGDGNLYHLWQLSPNGTNGWSGWANLIDRNIVSAVDLRTALSADGRLIAVVMTKEKTLTYIAQSSPNGGWGAAVDLDGNDLRWPCALIRGDDGRLQIGVVGGNRHIYGRWQVDPARQTLWGPWAQLGGQDLSDGLAMAINNDGQAEVFVIGGNGKLYRGFRSV
jgi:hypothetical protein